MDTDVVYMCRINNDSERTEKQKVSSWLIIQKLFTLLVSDSKVIDFENIYKTYSTFWFIDVKFVCEPLLFAIVNVSKIEIQMYYFGGSEN